MTVLIIHLKHGMEREGEDDEQGTQIGGDALTTQTTDGQVRVAMTMTVPSALLYAYLPIPVLHIRRHFTIGSRWRRQILKKNK